MRMKMWEMVGFIEEKLRLEVGECMEKWRGWEKGSGKSKEMGG